MKEIKFRAWDDVKDRMYYVGEEDDIGFNITSAGFIGFDLKEDHDSPFQLLEHLKYTQYTDIKDQHGVDVYEGDVIQCIYGNYQKYTAVVRIGHFEQDGSGGEYGPVDCYGVFAEKIIKKNKPSFYEFENTRSLLEFDQIEVIGNAFQNPELLEQDNA